MLLILPLLLVLIYCSHFSHQIMTYSIVRSLLTEFFGLRGPNAELATGRETGWGSEFTGLRQQQ